MKKLLMIAALIAAPAVAAAQVSPAVKGDPGFLDLNVIESWFDQEAHLEVNVHGALLNFVQEASRNEDEDLADMLHKLRGVYVRGYQVDAADVAGIADRTSQLAQTLASKGWETVVKVREEGERVDVFVRMNETSIAGLVVMVVDPEETIFVNIVGEIDPADIGRIGGRFNVPDIPGFGGDADDDEG